MTIEESAKAFFEARCLDQKQGIPVAEIPKSLFDLMAQFAQAQRNDMREMAAKWCDLQADLAKAISGNRLAITLAEERESAYTICAEEIRNLK